MPNSADLPLLKDVAFHVIKPYEFDTDGYRFLHGVALAWHQGKLYASFGHNQGGENTDTEQACYRVSEDDGNWIMAGISARGDAPAGGTHPAAVAISRGDDFTKWALVVIPPTDGLGGMWGESAVIVDGKRITNIARYGKKSLALVSHSDDFGCTWTPSRPSNLPMATSKPCAGTLSTDQRYLVCTTTGDSGGRRSPLTIAVSKPGDTKYCRIFVIRHAVLSESGAPAASQPESHTSCALSYPCASDHEGKLYVGYSNSGGGVGRKGQGRELWNNNSAELAVIPVRSLEIKP